MFLNRAPLIEERVVVLRVRTTKQYLPSHAWGLDGALKAANTSSTGPTGSLHGFPTPQDHPSVSPGLMQGVPGELLRPGGTGAPVKPLKPLSFSFGAAVPPEPF